MLSSIKEYSYLHTFCEDECLFCVLGERERKALIESPRAVVACTFEINSWDCSPEMTHEARYLIKGA